MLWPLPPRVRAIALMVIGTLFFASMHASVRQVSTMGLHAFEIAFFRNLFGLLVIVPWVWRYGLAPFHTSRLPLHGLRALLNAVAMIAFFWALTTTPLSLVTALTFAAPVFATALAVPFFGERAGVVRWASILVGFLGTLVVIRPGFVAVGLGPLLTLFAAVTWAVVLLIVKSLGRTESSITITAYMSLLITPIALVPALFVWQWPTGEQLVWLVAIGILGNIGQILMVQALHNGDTNVVMPIDYLRLLWVSAIAFFAFAEVPDNFTWAGGTMIFASAAYIAYRERKLSGRKTAPTPRPDD